MALCVWLRVGSKMFFPFHWRIGPLKVFWKQSTDSLPVNRLSILLLKHNGPSLLSQGPFHKDVGCSNLGHWQDISSTLIHNSKILCANSHLYKVTYSYFVRLGDMKSLDLNIANSNANTPVITSLNICIPRTLSLVISSYIKLKNKNKSKSSLLTVQHKAMVTMQILYQRDLHLIPTPCQPL